MGGAAAEVLDDFAHEDAKHFRGNASETWTRIKDIRVALQAEGSAFAFCPWDKKREGSGALVCRGGEVDLTSWFVWDLRSPFVLKASL